MRLPFIWRLAQAAKRIDFNEHIELASERLQDVLSAINANNHLLMRGLGALVSAGMLSTHPEFLEQACASLWIAQEASLYLFTRKLRRAGHLAPAARDVGQLLDAAFQSKVASDGYFETFYEERVKTLHPESRFGTYPGAPLCADEYYQLLGSLTAAYDYLLTGHVAPCFFGK